MRNPWQETGSPGLQNTKITQIYTIFIKIFTTILQTSLSTCSLVWGILIRQITSLDFNLISPTSYLKFGYLLHVLCHSYRSMS